MTLFRACILTMLFFLAYLPSAKSQEDLSIKKIRFKGNDSIPTEELLKLMNIKKESTKEQLAFWRKDAPFSSYTFEEDLQRLKKHYQQNGFLAPIITYDLKPNRRNTKLTINIHIKEGEPIRYGHISLKLNGDKTISKTIDSLQRKLLIQPEQRFRDEAVMNAQQKIASELSSKGYPFTNVETEIKLKESEQKADITYQINTGSKSYLGKVTISGDSLIDRAYILRHLPIKQGELFSQAKLETTQQELFDLALFRYVTIRAQLDSVQNNAIPITIQLKELPRWSLKTGLGYGTEDKVRVSMLLTRLNFLGGGRTLTVKGQHSYFLPLGVETKFIQPDIFVNDLDFILNPFYSQEREESYKVERIGTAVTFQKEVSKNTSAYISYSLGRDIIDLTKADTLLSTEEANNLIHNKSGITVGYARNTTNNIFSPSKGWKLNGTVTYMGLGFGSEYHYYKLLAEIAHFIPIGEKIVFATKLKGGIINATQNDITTPIEDRFLLGGSLSLRGWGRNQISPVNSAGDRLGGNSMMEGSAELRVPIYSIFSIAAFIDLGNNWEKSWEFDLTNLYYDGGLGLRITTPIGPLRFDFGIPINGTNHKLQIFATIGHAF